MKTIRITATAALLISSFAFAKAKMETFTLDSAKSEMNWSGKKVLVEKVHNGNVKISTGKIEFLGKELKSGSFEIDMTSINNFDLKDSAEWKAKLEGHLKSDDFFNVEKFPKAKFVIKSVKEVKATGSTHEITGDLTIRDKTNTITFPANIEIKDKTATAKASFKIDRSLFDVKFGSDKFFKNLGDKLIANEIEFTLNLVANK